MGFGDCFTFLMGVVDFGLLLAFFRDLERVVTGIERRKNQYGMWLLLPGAWEMWVLCLGWNDRSKEFARELGSV